MEMQKTHEILSEILTTIFQPEYRRLGKWIDRLCSENRAAYGDPELVGFIYNGIVYKPLELKASNTAIKRRGLHQDLAPNMDAYLKDLDLLTKDKAFISQSLMKLIDPCKNMQDVRDALPNCLGDTHSELLGIPREREPGWTIQDDPRAIRQYEKILPKIEMYSAGRLIY
jgi:hypothetical protein